MKAKIFILVDNLGTGGAQRQIMEYLKCADRSKFNIKVVNLDKDYDTLAGDVHGLGYEIIHVEHRGFFNVRTIVKLVKLFKMEKPDIVYTYLFTSDCYGRLAAKLAGVPIIISSVRNVDIWKRFYHIIADKILAKFTDSLVINAENIRPFLVQKEKIDPRKIVKISNGIDLNRFFELRNPREVKKDIGIPMDAFVIGMVARFKEQKDYWTFFDAAKVVIEKKPNVYFAAVGEGPLKDSLIDYVRSLGIQENVIFTGLRKDVPDIVNSFDIGVLASYYEGCSNVIMEYMTCSKAVIANKVGGNSELVIDRVTGYTVECKNPKILAKKMLMLLKNRNLLEQMGRAGRQRIVENFTVQKMTKNTERLFGALLEIKGIKKREKIAFVLSQFPETHETFILREIKALQAREVNLKILSLKRCKDKIIHPEAKELMKRTIYGRVFSSLLIAHSLLHPLRVFGAFFYVIRSYIKNPKELIKALYVFFECFYFVKVLKKGNVTHIHSHWATMPTTAAMVLSRLTDISFSFTAHAWDIFINSNGLAEKIERARFVVTCTDYNRRYLSGLVNGKSSVDKIYLNYHGINLKKFQITNKFQTEDKNPKFTILSIGRLVETKGFKYLIDACSILKNRGISFKCLIVGDGKLLTRLYLRTENQNLTNNIEFLGVQTQERIKELYNLADCFVLPCILAKNGDRDGIPNVLLEAMTMGVPVISTDFSGIPEAVIDKKTGILVPQKNSIALADAIEKLWLDESLRIELTEAGRKLVEEKFSIEKNIDELVRIFREKGVIDAFLSPLPSPQRGEGMRSSQRGEGILNVLYVIWSLGLGGAERVVINLAKNLDNERFRPIVCCLNDKGRFADELEKEGIEVIALDKKGKFDITVIRKLISVMKENNIKIVHTHLWGGNFWGRIAAKLAKVPVVIATEHNTDAWKSKFHLLMDRWLSRWTDKLIAVSESVKRFYVEQARLDPEEIEVIYNGIEKNDYTDFKKEIGLCDEEMMLGVIGRLVPQKGHRYFLLAIKELLKRYKVKGLIIGSGPLEAELRQFSENLGLDGSVMFTGLRQDIPDLLRQIDILVMPSLREGLSVVALEAMASGVPIVATKVGGNSEVIDDGETGILVEPEDAAALAEAIGRLVQEKEFAKRLGKNACRRVKEHFSLEKMVRETEELYGRCLGEAAMRLGGVLQ